MWDMAADPEDGILCNVESDPNSGQEEPGGSYMQERMPGCRRQRGPRLPVEVCQLPRSHNIHMCC
jgi:hypothetical protein